MCKTIISIIASFLLLPAVTSAQTFSSLWKQEQTAENKTLPKTQLLILDQIVEKAEAGKSYGHLLKAAIKQVKVWGDISPDSVAPALQRLVKKEQQAKGDPVLKAVYDAALGKIYDDDGFSTVLADGPAKAKGYFELALSQPKKLAATKAADFDPFVVEGANSKSLFNGDLLSVIGYETGQFGKLYDYYSSVGNRRAACITALEGMSRNFLQKKNEIETNEKVRKSVFLHSLDSLLSVYSDLDVAGEVAVVRYNYMSTCPDVTVEDKIRYIHYALERWGRWQRMGELRNAKRSLTTPSYGVAVEKAVINPNTEQIVRLSNLRNINSLTMNVYRTQLLGDTEAVPENNDWYKQIKSGLTLLPEQTRTLTFTGQPDYQVFSDSLKIGKLPAGVYMLEFTTSPSFQTQRGLYRVSDVFTLAQSLPEGNTRYVVVNATTGRPVPGAKLRLYTKKYDTNAVERSVTLTTDKNGEVVYKWTGDNNGLRLYAYTDKDKYSPSWVNYGQFYFDGSVRRTEHTATFTDRAIYRPGQTVHVSAIVYETVDAEQQTPVVGKTVKALLRDANYQLVAEKQIVTDKYGTCSVDFVLPEAKLSGRYSVEINNGSSSFNVEEYKRPTFKVEFPKVNEKYASGDTIIIVGKALSYAGMPVQKARVKYRVVRKPAYWWVALSPIWKRGVGGGDVVVNEGETTTASDGAFKVAMPMILPDEQSPTRRFYNFVAVADVTDAAGESHSGELSVPLGTRATAFSSDLADKVLSDSVKNITFKLMNASGEPVSAVVRFRIDNSSEWLTAQTSVPQSLPMKLSSGKHSLFALCENDTLEQEFVVFGLDDVKPCTATDDWFFVSSNSFPRDGSPVTVQVGSSAKDVHVVYTMVAGSDVLERGSFDVSNSLMNRKLLYKKSYGDGVSIAFAWVKDGRCYTHRERIERPLPDKRLTLSWTTFRDRLVPGQKEEWKLKITQPDGRPADAQLMATLYDQSLDQLRSHSWTFSPYSRLRIPSIYWECLSPYGIRRYRSMVRSSLESKLLDFSRFDQSVFPYFVPEMGTILYARAENSLSVKRMKVAAGSFDVAREESSKGDQLMFSVNNAGGNERNQSTNDVQVRENLNETAFFFPNLQTDGEGNVVLKFTLPESLTTWRFMGLAHTPGMSSGMITAEAVAQKKIMVQPNVPRFVRVGDQVRITTRINNTTTATLSGVATMTLTDPETDREVYRKSVDFSVNAGETTTAGFDFVPTDDGALLVCKITASGGDFSDGEQHYLPVLPDREQVTESVAFSQNAPGVKTIDIEKLFPKGSKRKNLTIEYANNPTWLVVQALPYVGNPHQTDAISLATSLYAGVVGAAVANSSPRIKQVFDLWKTERTGSLTLKSALTKNEELKNIVLDETPWVADAHKESEQKALLADFFDTNTMGSRNASAVEQLARLQGRDGSWSWWPGMDGNAYITSSVVSMLVRMHVLAGKQANADSLLTNALNFLDKKIIKQVAEMKRKEKEGERPSFPGTVALQYLYAYAIDGRKQSVQAKAASDYLLALLKKEIKGQTIYDKALTAIILNHHGDRTLAKEYVQSLKEYTVYSEDMGRYYDTRKASYYWCDMRIPTEVAAMEAIKTITPADITTIEEMKRWLLQQKRTQAWDNPISSADAIYAFLADNTEALASRPQTTFAIDGSELELPKATAGLGYIKTGIGSPAAGKTLTVTKQSEGTSWGAVYARFVQKSSMIENHSSGITLKREIIAERSKLKVGDRVKVRITLEARRTMDFVQVKDRKAACMEPVEALSGYRNGAYCSPKDNSMNYYFDRLTKGQKVVLETEYYLDRPGRYETGVCTAECAYSPEYRATSKSMVLEVEE